MTRCCYNMQKYTSGKFQYQLSFNLDLKQNWSKLIDINIYHVYLCGMKSITELYLYCCRHLIHPPPPITLWRCPQSTRSPINHKHITQYVSTMTAFPHTSTYACCFVFSTFLTGMQRRELDNSRTSHYESIVL